MKLTQPILTTLSRELSHGNPWWALVVLNEYLRPTTPLHTAFVSHCKRRMPLDSQLARRLYAGARYEELSLEERACVGVRTMTIGRSTWKASLDAPALRVVQGYAHRSS